MFDSELPNKDYYYQLHGYMALTGKQSGAINYCLMDASEELINRECTRQSYAQDKGGEIDTDLYDEVRSKMTYSHLDNSLRLKRFEVKRDEEVIKSIRERVKLCRKYINEQLLNKL